MDTFNEQIVKIRPTAKTTALRMLVWVAAIAISTLLIVNFEYLRGIIVLLEFVLFYGAWKLSQQFSIEYEYILTNGDLDIDKITAQSSRKRIFTIKCGEIEAVGKYQKGMQLHGKLYMCCNESDDAYYIITRDKTEGTICLVFAPDEKLQSAIKLFLPRIIQKDAFSN